MISREILSLVLITVLFSSLHDASFVFQAPGKQVATLLNPSGTTSLFGLAFADSGESDTESSNNNQVNQSGQDVSNNQTYSGHSEDNIQSNQENNQTQSENQMTNENKNQTERQSENNTLQFNQESNQTQSEHQAENQVTNENKNQTEHEGENANKTEAEHQAETEQKSTEIQNENNNLNATHLATEQDVSDITEAKTNQTIAAQVDIGAGNVSEKSIDSNVVVKVENTTTDAVNMTVSASSQSGPKVILINLNSTTIDVGNIKYLHIMYDGQPIVPASDVSQVLHPVSSDQPHFAILVTQSGAQILISIPHFSTHTITITSISKVISPVPEFPPSAIAVFVTITAITVAITRKRLNLFS